MNHYVYKTVHVPSGRWYIGIRSSRITPKEDKYLGSGLILKSLLKKHPRVEFSKQILAVARTREEAAQIERRLVGPSELSDPLCLNVVEGGQRGFAGGKHSGSARRKMSESRKRVLLLDPSVEARRVESLRLFWAQATREQRNSIWEGRRRSG